MKTIAWFHELAKQSGKTQTALAREIEAVRRGQGGIPNSKWSWYRKGRDRPSRDVLDAAARLAPSARALYEHPVWACLDLEIDVRSGAEAIAARLGDRVRRPVLTYLKTASLSSRDRDRLERTPTLDGLAAHLLLARFDAEVGQTNASAARVLSIAKTMLVCSPQLYRLGIARPLADFIEQEIYPLMPDAQERVYSNCGLNFIEACVIWQSCLPALERQAPEGYSVIEAPFALLSGDYGLDLVFGLLPLRVDRRNFAEVKASLAQDPWWVEKLRALYCLRNPDISPGWKSLLAHDADAEGPWAFPKKASLNEGAVWPPLRKNEVRRT